MHTTIVKHIPRVEAGIIRRLGELGVATVHEALGRQGLLDPVIRPIYPGARAAGSAVTVCCPAGDNLMIHAALQVVQRGDVLVVTTLPPSTYGMFGDVLGTSCQALGVAGLVIDAGIRDTEELERMAFPAWSRAISAEGTIKVAPGVVNAPIVCAGVNVRPGDVVVADRDGVVIVPRERAAEAAELGEQRRDREIEYRRRLSTGELTLDVLDLRRTLREIGMDKLD